MKKTACIACALSVFLATWPRGRIEAEPRCYPIKRFAAPSGGVVRDDLTGLNWQQQASPTSMTWAAAQDYCPSGFRLPTVKELSSIVDFAVAPPGPAIDQTAFPGTPAEGFWTSSPYAGLAGYAWLVLFTDGYSSYVGATNNCRVRCVR
jgi:hypothetical protein